jgi:hypothetical protein
LELVDEHVPLFQAELRAATTWSGVIHHNEFVEAIVNREQARQSGRDWQCRE